MYNQRNDPSAKWLEKPNFSKNCFLFYIASEDLIRNEQEKALSLRKKKFDEFFLKKRLHGVINPDSKDYSQFFLEIQERDLTIPKEQQLQITSLVSFPYKNIRTIQFILY